MSITYSNRMYLIPADSTYIPDNMAAHKAWMLLRSFLPNAEAISIVVYPSGNTIFGELAWSKIVCPNCNTTLIDTTLNERGDELLSYDKWWVSVQAAKRRGESVTTLPCCGVTLPVSDIDRPYRHAHFALEVEQPGTDLSIEQLAQLGQVLDCELAARWHQYHHTKG